jgi:hypothetical protein
MFESARTSREKGSLLARWEGVERLSRSKDERIIKKWAKPRPVERRPKKILLDPNKG